MLNPFQKKRPSRRAAVLKVALPLVALVSALAGAYLVLTQVASGSWNMFASPTPTPTFTSTPIMPTATLFVPSETPTLTLTATRSAAVEYTVQAGDNLFYIAEQFQVSVGAIVAYNKQAGNDLVGDMMQPNQVIMIPPPSYTQPTATVVPQDAKPGTVIEYSVQPGDILEVMAFNFNTTVDAILKANETLAANPNLLRAGDVLKIPINLLYLTPPTPIPPTRRPTPTLAATAKP